MDALDEKWNVIEKAHNFQFLLRLFAFSVLLDLVLAWATGKNLISISWNEIGARPGLLLITVLAYGFTGTVGAAILFHVGGFAFSFMSSGAQPTAPKSGFTQNEAQTWLENPQHDALRRQYVDKQIAERNTEVRKWHDTVLTSWAAIAILVASLFIKGSSADLLLDWKNWTFWALLGIVALPVMYHLRFGAPGHDFVVLPEYAKELETQRRRPSCLTEGGTHLEDSSRADKPNVAQTYDP